MKEKLTSVKIDTIVVDKVRKNKKKTKIPVGAFFALAAEEKLKKHDTGKRIANRE